MGIEAATCPRAADPTCHGTQQRDISNIEIAGGTLVAFEIGVGVHQGTTPCLQLFITVMEEATMSAGEVTHSSCSMPMT